MAVSPARFVEVSSIGINGGMTGISNEVSLETGIAGDVGAISTVPSDDAMSSSPELSPPELRLIGAAG